MHSRRKSDQEIPVDLVKGEYYVFQMRDEPLTYCRDDDGRRRVQG